MDKLDFGSAHAIGQRPTMFASIAPYVEWPVLAGSLVLGVTLEGPEQLGAYVAAALVGASIGATALLTRVGPAWLKYLKDRDDVYHNSVQFKLEEATEDRVKLRAQLAEQGGQLAGQRKQLAEILARYTVEQERSESLRKSLLETSQRSLEIMEFLKRNGTPS